MAYVFSTPEFKEFFQRDFPFQPEDLPVDLEMYIQDSDITKAVMKSRAYYKVCWFSDDEEMQKLAMFYIVAHILCIDIKTSSMGLNGKFEWPINSKSVGSVSASYTIPAKFTDDPYYSWLTSTSYGMEYLVMILPCATGGMFVVPGFTYP